MSHTKIATKILEIMKNIPDEQAFGRLNSILIEQKLIPQMKYEIVKSKERATVQGVAWQIIAVSCSLTIIDTESDEEITYVALGIGMDYGDRAAAMAQVMARRYAWATALNVEVTELEDTVPEIIVETPENKIVAGITALWRWSPEELITWVTARFKRPLDQLNLAELSVLKSELENYGR